jgi:hypothetical protein
MTRTGCSPASHASRCLRTCARYLRACWWLSLGVHVLPLKHRSKHLQPGFGPHKARISDPSFARQWFLNTNANLGVLLGGSSYLLVADWDDASAYEAWRATRGASVETLVEQTPRGFHAFFFSDEHLPSAAQPGCELKTSGACAVFPSLHPSGDLYRIACSAPIARLSAARARSLFPFLSAANPLTPLTPQPSLPLGVGLIARIKAAHSTLDEMLDAGVELRPAGPNTLIGRCPFHDDHTPSLWLYPDSGLWGCNRPDCPAHGVHDVCNFRALRFGISNRAAIRQLACQFL